MSLAWMAPVPVWREPLWASILRVGMRLVMAIAWTTAAVLAPASWLAAVFSVLGFLAFAHAVLAVANRVKNGGVLLRLMGTGTLEWPPSIQERLLRRPLDWVDGAAIEVVPLEPIPVRAPAAPHVALVGATHRIERLPLYRRTEAEFMDEVNAILAPRGIALVEQGTVHKPRGGSAD